MKFITLQLILFGLVGLSCNKDNEVFIYQIEPSLKPYFIKFLEEAKSKNTNIDTTNLIIKFGKSQTELCGECRIEKKGKGQRTILIDTTERFCWISTSIQNREALVFHEIGHCLLNRSHRNDVLPVLNKDAPASIMTVSPFGLYEPCVYPIGDPKDCDKRYRRPYYIDELFDTKTPVPTW